MKTTQHISRETNKVRFKVFVVHPSNQLANWLFLYYFFYLTAWIVFLIPLSWNLHHVPLGGDVEVPGKN